jgi:hypothetical protein
MSGDCGSDLPFRSTGTLTPFLLLIGVSIAGYLSSLDWSDSFFLFLFQKREKKEKEEEYLRPCKRDRVLGRIKDLPTAVERDLVTSTLSKVASWKRMKR